MNYNYSVAKNIRLIAQRGIGFDEVIEAIESGHVLDVREHTNKERYPHQELIVVEVRGYIYMVPCVKQENGVTFLKTIYPSRKAKKYYLRGGAYGTQEEN